MKLSSKITAVAIPIVAVNITSILAQFEFWHAHLQVWGVPGQILFAFSLESVAVALCVFAHAAMVAGDSAFKLRLSAILFAVGIATINGTHYLNHGRLTAASIGIFACSAISPWLWGTYSRRASRDALIASGLIEGHSVRLGSARWLFHPVMTYRVFSDAVWTGEQNPQTAITAYAERVPEPEPEPEPEPVPVSVTTAPVRNAITAGSVTRGSKAGAVTAALAALGNDASGPAIAQWCAARGVSVTSAYVRQIKSRAANRDVASRRDSLRAIGNGHYPNETVKN